MHPCLKKAKFYLLKEYANKTSPIFWFNERRFDTALHFILMVTLKPEFTVTALR